MTSIRQALIFIRDMADEEHAHSAVGTGSECVLRHIARRAREALFTLDASEKEPLPSPHQLKDTATGRVTGFLTVTNGKGILTFNQEKE